MLNNRNCEIFGPYNFWTPLKSNIPDVCNWNCWILFRPVIEVGGHRPTEPPKGYVPVALLLSIITFSLPAPDKLQHFVHLGFNSTLQLINGISGDFQKLFKYFNGTAIITFLSMSLAPSTTLFPNNSALFLKDINLLVFSISALKLVASS